MACPDIGRIPDANCDGKATIVVIGDSLVAGTGDTKNGGKGGYVLRAQEYFTEATFANYGEPGLRTPTLIKRVRKAFSNPSTTLLAQDLIAADLVLLDVGRNDRWFYRLPITTIRNLIRVRTMIGEEVTKITGNSPLIVTAVLMYPNRSSQGPWVKELDELIAKSDSEQYPADIRFDKVSKKLLSSDNIHPTPKGYAAMAEVFIKYLLKNYREHINNLRKDSDSDGLFDLYERVKFGTDPANPETDGDGLSDGIDPSPAG
jgi:lysophospholipase L1-like esterase